MSTLTNTPPVRAADATHRLCSSFTAVRLSFTWLGVRKALSAEQTARAADVFDAAGPYLSAGKKLLDTKHPAFRTVTAVRGRIVSAWKIASLPYPEPGMRLIRQDDVQPFCVRMTTLQAELADAVATLDDEYDALRQAARQRLGSLYNSTDYPATLCGRWTDSHLWRSICGVGRWCSRAMSVNRPSALSSGGCMSPVKGWPRRCRQKLRNCSMCILFKSRRMTFALLLDKFSPAWRQSLEIAAEAGLPRPQ